MTVELQPLVSIVTPVYNEERYLPECVESILAQRYTNWDYTIVNNASTDRTGQIARRYAAQDRRIRVVENATCIPVIENHNLAVRQISPASKYCKVVFGDDWILPDCLNRMVEVGETHPSVGIVGAFGLLGEEVVWTGLPPGEMFPGREICRAHMLDFPRPGLPSGPLYVFGSATSLLYRTEVIKQKEPFYNTTHLHGDTEVCFAILTDWDFGFVHEILTGSRVRDGSLTSFSRSMNTYLGAQLNVIVTFGPSLLSPSEFSACLDRKVTGYYEYLAASALRPHRMSFWIHHRAQFVKSGIELEWSRVVSTLLARAGRRVARGVSGLSGK